MVTDSTCTGYMHNCCLGAGRRRGAKLSKLKDKKRERKSVNEEVDGGRLIWEDGERPYGLCYDASSPFTGISRLLVWVNRGQSLHSRLSERFFSHRRERPELSATGGEIHLKVAATQTCLHTS